MEKEIDMKVYTEVIYQWDDDANKLVEKSSQSYDYEGNVDLLQVSGAMPTNPWETFSNDPLNTAEDFRSLLAIQQRGSGEGGMNDYLSEAFGLKKSDDYMEFITPFKKKPFDILEQDYTNVLENLAQTTGVKVGGASGQASQAIAKSGFATSGTISSALEAQKRQILDAYSMDRRSATADYASKIYGEETQQVDKLYEDISNIIRLTKM